MVKVTLGVQNPQYLWSLEQLKVTIYCLYKVIHELSIGAKMYDLGDLKARCKVFCGRSSWN